MIVRYLLGAKENRPRLDPEYKYDIQVPYDPGSGPMMPHGEEREGDYLRMMDEQWIVVRRTVDYDKGEIRIRADGVHAVMTKRSSFFSRRRRMLPDPDMPKKAWEAFTVQLGAYQTIRFEPMEEGHDQFPEGSVKVTLTTPFGDEHFVHQSLTALVTPEAADRVYRNIEGVLL